MKSHFILLVLLLLASPPFSQAALPTTVPKTAIALKLEELTEIIHDGDRIGACTEGYFVNLPKDASKDKTHILYCGKTVPWPKMLN